MCLFKKNFFVVILLTLIQFVSSQQIGRVSWPAPFDSYFVPVDPQNTTYDITINITDNAGAPMNGLSPELRVDFINGGGRIVDRVVMNDNNDGSYTLNVDFAGNADEYFELDLRIGLGQRNVNSVRTLFYGVNPTGGQDVWKILIGEPFSLTYDAANSWGITAFLYDNSGALWSGETVEVDFSNITNGNRPLPTMDMVDNGNGSYSFIVKPGDLPPGESYEIVVSTPNTNNSAEDFRVVAVIGIAPVKPNIGKIVWSIPFDSNVIPIDPNSSTYDITINVVDEFGKPMTGLRPELTADFINGTGQIINGDIMMDNNDGSYTLNADFVGNTEEFLELEVQLIAGQRNISSIQTTYYGDNLTTASEPWKIAITAPTQSQHWVDNPIQITAEVYSDLGALWPGQTVRIDFRDLTNGNRPIPQSNMTDNGDGTYTFDVAANDLPANADYEVTVTIPNTNNNVEDFKVIKITANIGIEQKPGGLDMYITETHNEIRIDIGLKDIPFNLLKIFDALGNIKYQKSIISNKVAIDKGILGTGTFFIITEYQNKFYWKKFRYSK